jgi:hypothetical protein
MKAETRMDLLLQRLVNMDALVDLRPSPEDEDEAEGVEKRRKSSGKKSGGKQGGGFFGGVTGEIFFRRSSEKSPSIHGITHPSDGHPQEELTPDFGWFRSLSYNNPTWTLFWPELII